MARPRCPVCRSKRWHRDALSGSIVCEEGHLLQGYVQETTDTQEGPSQYTQTTRKIRKNRQRKIRPPNNDYYHGARATFAVWQAMQLIFREQCRVVIDELGWPVEIEAVARDLWGMLVASSNVPPAPRDYDRDEEMPGSYSGPKPGDRYTRKGRKKKSKRSSGGDGGSDSQDEGEDGDDHNGTGAATSGTERQRDDDDSQESDASSLFSAAGVEADDERPSGKHPASRSASRANTATPPPGPGDGEASDAKENYANLYAPPKRRRLPAAMRPPVPSADPRDAPRLEFTLLLLYLACVSLRLPIFLSDIFRLAETYRIPYLDAGLHLPSQLQLHLSHAQRALLSPSAVPSLFPISQTLFGVDASAQTLLARMVALYKEDWELEFPEANVEGLLGRVCGLVGLPPLVQTLTLRLLTSLPSPSSNASPSPSLSSTSLFSLPATLSLHAQPLRPHYARRKAKYGSGGKEMGGGHWVVPEEKGAQDWRTALAEVKVATAVAVVLRVLTGTDEKEGTAMREYDSTLPAQEKWVEVLEQLAELDKPEELEKLWSKDPAEMGADEIDAYLDFFEEKIVSKEKVPTRMTDISRYFRSVDAPASTLPSSSAAAETYLSTYTSLVSSLASSSSTSAFTLSANVLEPLLTSLAAHLLPPPRTYPTAYGGAAPTIESSSKHYLLNLIHQLESTLATLQPSSSASAAASTKAGKQQAKQHEEELFGVATAQSNGRQKKENMRRKRVERIFEEGKEERKVERGEKKQRKGKGEREEVVEDEEDDEVDEREEQQQPESEGIVEDDEEEEQDQLDSEEAEAEETPSGTDADDDEGSEEGGSGSSARSRSRSRSRSQSAGMLAEPRKPSSRAASKGAVYSSKEWVGSSADDSE